MRIMSSGITNIAHSIEGRIEDTCRNVFMSYPKELAKQPMTYIIYSVWGESVDGELTSIQKAIHAMLQPTVEQIFQSLALENLTLEKRMGIEYLIRGFIISKLLFMVEYFKTTASKIDTFENNYQKILNNVGVIGPT